MSRRGVRYRRERLSAQAGQSAVFGADADRQNDGVQGAEDERDLPQAEDDGEDRDLADDDQIVGVIDETVGSSADKRSPGFDDDARGPALTERADDPDPAGLKKRK